MDKHSFEELTSKHPEWVHDSKNAELHSFKNGSYIIKNDSSGQAVAEHYELENVDDHIELLLSGSGKRYMILDRSNEEYPVLELLRVDENEHEQIHLISLI